MAYKYRSQQRKGDDDLTSSLMRKADTLCQDLLNRAMRNVDRQSESRAGPTPAGPHVYIASARVSMRTVHRAHRFDAIAPANAGNS